MEIMAQVSDVRLLIYDCVHGRSPLCCIYKKSYNKNILLLFLKPSLQNDNIMYWGQKLYENSIFTICFLYYYVIYNIEQGNIKVFFLWCTKNVHLGGKYFLSFSSRIEIKPIYIIRKDSGHWCLHISSY